MHKAKKILLISLSAIAVLIVVVILFISPIVKYLVEKYDVQYTGREISMDWAYVNPFTGYLHFSNIRVHEMDSDSVFISANAVSAHVSLLKMFSKTYEISDLTLSQPHGIIIQNIKDLNFSDLIEKFSAKENPDEPETKVHFNILNVKIEDGEFYYHEKTIPINYAIKKVNFESAGKRWDVDTVAVKFSFLPGSESGDIKGQFTINVKNLDYRVAVVANKFDLQILAQYLKELTNYGSFSATLDADIQSTGNLKDEENINSKGLIAINNFHFGKNRHDDYASFERLALQMIEMSPKNHVYNFDSVSLIHPYFKYEKYKFLNNLEAMFGANWANVKAAKAKTEEFNLVIEIVRYIKLLGNNFFQSNYKINKMTVSSGDIRFSDFSVAGKFTAELYPLYVTADSIDKKNKHANVYLKSGILPYGNVAIALSINLKDTGEFDLHYRFQKIAASMFNPYIISYTSFPLDRGTVECRGVWKIRNSIIKSSNHLKIINPRATARVSNKDTKWVPLPLIFFFVRVRGNVLYYEIPITGNIKNPKFHLNNVIGHLIKNIFIKPHIGR